MSNWWEWAATNDVLRQMGMSCWPMQGHTAAVLDVAWTPAGDRLASAGWDETVRVWVVEGFE